MLFSFLILVASCVCIPLNIPYLYTNGLPLPPTLYGATFAFWAKPGEIERTNKHFGDIWKRKENERVGNLRRAWKIENDSWSLSWIENLSLSIKILIEETQFIFLVPDYLERWSVGSGRASSIPRWPGIICQRVQAALREKSWFVASWIGEDVVWLIWSASYWSDDCYQMIINWLSAGKRNTTTRDWCLFHMSWIKWIQSRWSSAGNQLSRELYISILLIIWLLQDVHQLEKGTLHLRTDVCFMWVESSGYTRDDHQLVINYQGKRSTAHHTVTHCHHVIESRDSILLHALWRLWSNKYKYNVLHHLYQPTELNYEDVQYASSTRW